MRQNKQQQRPGQTEAGIYPIAPGKPVVSELSNREEAEVLNFLLERVAHTFGMIGFIRANGLVSPHNRGKFYACRNQAGDLEGVALIGHATLFDARSEAAIKAFAKVAQGCRDVHMLLGEQQDVQSFWGYYEEGGQQPRLQCREMLYEMRCPVEGIEPVASLRLATLDDLDMIVPVHARMVYEESGIDPLESDAEGFRRRCARRIECGKTWVWVEGDRLMFKADIVTDSPEVIYLEGVEVCPEERGKGHGFRCMSQLSRELLERTGALVLLVNEERKAAQAFYNKAGFILAGCYDTIFLNSHVC
jgi:predicted GNAT family acetyltransferase